MDVSFFPSFSLSSSHQTSRTNRDSNDPKDMSDALILERLSDDLRTRELRHPWFCCWSFEVRSVELAFLSSRRALPISRAKKFIAFFRSSVDG